MDVWMMERLWLTATRVYAFRERRWSGSGARNSAQSTVEYALVGALVVIAAAGALTLLGGELTNVFTHISDTLKTASSATH